MGVPVGSLPVYQDAAGSGNAQPRGFLLPRTNNGSDFNGKEWSASQLSAAYLEAVQPAQQRDRDLIRVEQVVGHGHHLLTGDGLDLVHDFVYAEKMLKVHFLAGQVR